MTTTEIQSPLEAARALAPVIQAHGEQIEQERCLPQPVVAALTQAGLFRLLIPRRYGGAEANPATFVRVVEEVARADGATGWCVMIGGFYGLFAGCLPAPAAREIYGSDPHVVSAGAFRPNGQAVVVDGGYCVRGRWPQGSGIQHAPWLVGGCRLFDGEQPRLNASGVPVQRLMFFPAADAEVIDTWYTAGLRGTGSHDYAVTDVFVPAERSLSFREPPVEPGPLYALPLIAYGSLCIAAVPLGIARHAIDTLAELAGVKTSSASRTPLREHALAQRDLGRAEALVGAGRAYLYQTLDETWQTVCAGRALSDSQRARLWLAGTHAATCAMEAVDLMFSAGGTTAVYATSPLERCLRDIRTAAQHICVVPDNYLMAGQALLGLDMSPTRLYNDHRGEA